MGKCQVDRKSEELDHSLQWIKIDSRSSGSQLWVKVILNLVAFELITNCFVVRRVHDSYKFPASSTLDLDTTKSPMKSITRATRRNQRHQSVSHKYKKWVKMLKLVDLYLYTNLDRTSDGSQKFAKRRYKRKRRVFPRCLKIDSLKEVSS